MTSVAQSHVTESEWFPASALAVPPLERKAASRDPGASAITKPASPSTLGSAVASLWFVSLAILYGRDLAGAVHVIPPGSHALSDWSPVVSRCCTLTFLLILGWLMLARPPAIARRAGALPVAIAFLGTYAAWLLPFLPAAHVSAAMGMASAGVTLCGSLMIVLAVLHLGRSFSIAPQARKLITSGPYRIVRHPLYAAEEIALIGVLLQYAWYMALPFLAVHMALQIRRMAYEESLLRAVFPDYEAYARRTARLIPGVW